jgi:hypothetical protein
MHHVIPNKRDILVPLTARSNSIQLKSISNRPVRTLYQRQLSCLSQPPLLEACRPLELI